MTASSSWWGGEHSGTAGRQAAQSKDTKGCVLPAERFYQRTQGSASWNRFGPSRREEVDLGPGEREGGSLEIKAGGFEQARGEQTGRMHRERKNVSGP